MSRGGLLVLALLIASIVAFKFLPWYALVGMVILLFVGLKFFGKRLLLRLFSMPFRAKGAVLRNASATIHNVERVAAPPDPPAEADDEDDEGRAPDCPREYFHIDVTITPAPSQGPFHHWEIGELSLVHPDFDQMNDDGPLSNYCQVREVEIQVSETFRLETEDDDGDGQAVEPNQERSMKVGEFVPDRGYKVIGPQRLRLLVGAVPEARQLKFAYYFEKFGVIDLPAAQPSSKKRKPVAV